MSAGAFIPLVHSQLAELRKQCSFSHKNLRDSISEAESYLQSVNTATDVLSLDKALDPFFKAMNEKKRAPFQLTVLDCFFKVFKQTNQELYPNRKLTQDIVSELIKADKNNSDDMNLLMCNVCIACLRSCSGIYFCHGPLLKQMFELLFTIYNSCENPATLNSIKTSINETLLALFDSYLQPPELPKSSNLGDFSQQITDAMVQNSLWIQEYLGGVLDLGDYTPTIRDVDVYLVIELFASIVEKNVMKTKTICLAADFLVFSLKQKCEFFKKNAFNVLLQSQINVTILSLALDMRQCLAPATAELVLTIWTDFAPIYNEGLNNFLVKGLATTLTSPDPAVLERSLTIYGEIAKHPQFFVDAFVNYDCDESGYFGNVFENTVNLLVKLAYPDVPVQRKAIEVIINILGSLWNYFTNFQVTETQNVEPEAPATFLEAKKTKNVFAEGVEVFKKGFKKGMVFFKQHGFVEDDPEQVAKFLFNTPALDPSEVGQLLGDARHTDVLKHFASQFDFTGMTFEQAFRQFLQKFQIPGEAQMIDRVMEQFGTKYYNDNKSMFSCADTVYVLAFSALMLHTDAHHPNVKSRMTLDQFVTNNKGIDGGKDLPLSFLTELYHGITTKRIYLSSNAASVPNSSLLTREQKADLYRNQCSQTISEARQANRKGQDRDHTFHRSESPLFIGPMFEAVWRGALAVLTQTFASSDDPELYRACLKGLGYAVHIASHCFIESALDTLVDSFGTFTGLRRGLRDAKTKNIDCTNELIEIAYKDRNYLRGAWEIVMGELSALDKMTTSSIGAINYNVEMVNLMFETTQQLDRESIVDFINAVCKVSSSELAEEPSRLFLLEKLNLVTHFNMNRPRYIWLSIWDRIGDHLKRMCCSSQLDLAYIGINQLRQIGQKFLEQPELTQFHFQQHFMSPFVYIYGKQDLVEAKDYLLENISGLMLERAEQLQSGWSVIIEILQIAATEPTGQKRGFEIVSTIINQFLDIVSEHYTDMISILCSFCRNAELSIRTRAVDAFLVVSKKIPHENTNVWTILLDGLARAGQDDEDAVRRKVHEVFLAIMADGEALPQGIIEHFFQESLPQMFDRVTDPEFFISASEFQTSLFAKFINPSWERLSSLFVPIIRCACKNMLCKNDLLVRSSIDAFTDFITGKYATLVESQKTMLFQHLQTVASGISTMSVANGKLFISMIDTAHESSNETKFISVLETTNNICASTNSHIIWAANRSALLRAFLRAKGEDTNVIAECLESTLTTFLSTTFPYDMSGDSSIAWNQTIVVCLQTLNTMSSELFLACFHKCCEPLLELIAAQSLEIRKQVNACMQRKLIKN